MTYWYFLPTMMKIFTCMWNKSYLPGFSGRRRRGVRPRRRAPASRRCASEWLPRPLVCARRHRRIRALARLRGVRQRQPRAAGSDLFRIILRVLDIQRRTARHHMTSNTPRRVCACVCVGSNKQRKGNGSVCCTNAIEKRQVQRQLL